MLFLHAERWQWHNDDPDYDGYAVLSRLQLPYLRTEGYVNLRCAWVLGCPGEIRPLQDSTDLIEGTDTGRTYKKAFEELLPDEPIPTVVGVSCCAQFGASRDTIRKRRREEYIGFREWLSKTELEDATSGRVFEYMWHSKSSRQTKHNLTPITHLEV